MTFRMIYNVFFFLLATLMFVTSSPPRWAVAMVGMFLFYSSLTDEDD